MVNQQIFLPMIPDSAPIVINIAQYDYDAAGYAGRLYFNLISNGTAYDMNGATATFQGEKPDGTTFAYAGTVVNASVVRVNVRQQMTLVSGRVVCQLVLNNSEGQIGSFNVWLEVQESATSGSTPSQTDIPSLVAQAKQYADDAQQSAETAAAYSGHPPYIGANNNWFVWDDDTSQFVDTDVSALGEGIVSITKTGTSGLVDTYTITYTNGATTTFDVTNGSAPNITMTAQADNTSSATPTVTVTQSGTVSNPSFDLAFSGLKGEQGATGAQGPTGPSGRGITSIAKTGTSGLVDTYTITYSDNTTSTFTVTNGQNGTGSGDMLQSAYDATLAVYNAGGIVPYVASQIPTATVVVDNLNSTSSTAALSANMGHELDTSKQDKLTFDTAPTSGSSNPVTSGGVYSALSNKADSSDVTAINNLIPSTATTSNKLATQSDLPTVNNGQLTIEQNGTTKGTFTANQSSGATANIVTDDWVATASVSTGEVTFSGIDDSGNHNYAYEPYFDYDGTSATEANPTASLTSASGVGTNNMSLTYSTNAKNGTGNARLRRIK